jgi:hypothetical protein
LNGYIEQSKFDSNFTAYFDSNFWLNIFNWLPLTDANISIPNVWSAIDGNRKAIDLNAYIDKAKFDANFSELFDVNFFNRFDGNLNSLFKTQYDANQTKREQDINRSIQNAIDLNGWYKAIDVNKLIQNAIDLNNWVRWIDGNLVYMKKADMNTQYYTQTDANTVLVKQNAFPLVDANINNLAWGKLTGVPSFLTNPLTSAFSIAYDITLDNSNVYQTITGDTSYNNPVSYSRGISVETSCDKMQVNGCDEFTGFRFVPAQSYAETSYGFYCDTTLNSGSNNCVYAIDGDIVAGTGSQFTGSGAGLTSVPDSALTSNICLLDASNNFTGSQNDFKDLNARDINASRDLNVWGKLKVSGTINGTTTTTWDGKVSAQDCGAGQVLQAVNSTGNGTCVANLSGGLASGTMHYTDADLGDCYITIINGLITAQSCTP